MSQANKANLLVELDCILDTRLATVDRIDPHVAYELAQSDDYYSRRHDRFDWLTNDKISQQIFDEAYAARDVKTLRYARPTNIARLVHDIANDIAHDRIQDDRIPDLTVVVNTYPYRDLSLQELDAIKQAMGWYVGIDCQVELAYFDNSELTPTVIKDQYDGSIIYDFNDWFTQHAQEMNTVLAPRNLMFAPALYINPEEALEDDTEERFKVTPFNVVEASLVERIKLELLNAREFSLVDLTA